ncbi:thermonuclease family protein [Sulfitobacter sp. S190]|nr:thermonuclease family protein [Sulfitobacter sp. S190]
MVAVGLTVQACAPVSTDTVSGPARVIDGDTLDVDGTRIRLHAIDAPENDQTCRTEQGVQWGCGAWVTDAVRARLQGDEIRCNLMERDRYGRHVARCNLDGDDIGAWLVGEGLAFAYVRYGDDYAALERDAARLDRGLHAQRLQSPAQHRATRAKGRIPPDAACPIKGNISGSGTRIFHMPQQAHYERTGINTDKGERWFCSAEAARAAGWRAARR